MQEKRKAKMKRIGYRLFMSIVALLIFFVSSVFLEKAMGLIMRNEARFSSVFQVCAKSAILIFWFFSLTRTFMRYDSVYLSRYCFKKEDETKTERWLSIVGNADFWIEIALFWVALSILPRSGPFGFWIGFSEEKIGALPLDLPIGFLTITVLPVFLVLLFFSHLSAQKFISGFDDPYLTFLEGAERNPGKKRFLVELLQTLAIYFIGALALPLTFPVIMTMATMLGRVPVLIFFLILVLFLSGFRYFRAFLKRRSFRKKLLKFCKEKSFRMEMHRGFFRSVFFMAKTYDFSVFVGDERYDCKMISSPRKYSPVFFDKTGDLIRTRTVRITRDLILFHSVSIHHFQFSSDGKKIVILNPTPHRIFLQNGQRKTSADEGERIGEYVIFTGSGFLNALERDCMQHFFQ